MVFQPNLFFSLQCVVHSNQGKQVWEKKSRERERKRLGAMHWTRRCRLFSISRSLYTKVSLVVVAESDKLDSTTRKKNTNAAFFISMLLLL